MTKVGKAYGFIGCSKTIDEVRGMLPLIRQVSQTPSNLELTVTEGIENIVGDKVLHETVIRDLKTAGNFNYAFEASLTGHDNVDTANELGSIVNQLYQSPIFEPKPKDFYATVVYERNGQYEQLE